MTERRVAPEQRVAPERQVAPEQRVAPKRQPPTDYQALPLLRIARLYLNGQSLRDLARKFDCNDHKPLGRYLAPYVEALGGSMRSQAESQDVRREQERQNSANDVIGWHDYALGQNRRSR